MLLIVGNWARRKESDSLTVSVFLGTNMVPSFETSPSAVDFGVSIARMGYERSEITYRWLEHYKSDQI